MTRTRTPEQIARLSAAALNKALDALDAEQSRLLDDLIAAGFGHTSLRTIVLLDHPVAQQYARAQEQIDLLRNEVARRYGPGAPSRLPLGKGFGPIKDR
jgi:uncharacterized protein involved in exopolysaccharide biosynthesis